MRQSECSKQSACIGHGCIHCGAVVEAVVIIGPYGIIGCVPLCHRVFPEPNGLETWRHVLRDQTCRRQTSREGFEAFQTMVGLGRRWMPIAVVVIKE